MLAVMFFCFVGGSESKRCESSGCRAGCCAWNGGGVWARNAPGVFGPAGGGDGERRGGGVCALNGGGVTRRAGCSGIAGGVARFCGSALPPPSVGVLDFTKYGLARRGVGTF